MGSKVKATKYIFKLDITRRASVDDYAFAWCDLDLWPLTLSVYPRTVT